MVQIILARNHFFSHTGSDFISHMVQIILDVSGWLPDMFRPYGFISHMVQIILCKKRGQSNSFNILYIPHGSDNTSSTVRFVSWSIIFFISHMVQIIRTAWIGAYCLCRYFISHMVQIIPGNTITFEHLDNSYFISHMVQIIQVSEMLSMYYFGTNFISVSYTHLTLPTKA